MSEYKVVECRICTSPVDVEIKKWAKFKNKLCELCKIQTRKISRNRYYWKNREIILKNQKERDIKRRRKLGILPRNKPSCLEAKIKIPKTHCPQGHEYDEVNTYKYKGLRSCRICRKVRRVAFEKGLRKESL